MDDSKTKSDKARLEFRGGKLLGAIPMLFFIVWAVYFSFQGFISNELLITGMVIGIMIGLFFCKSKWTQYADVVVEGMTQKIAIIAVLAYFWAGMFAGLLSAGGFVDGLIWFGIETGISGGFFTGLTFILACLFATAAGTAYGTIATFGALMFPAGIILGANPVVLIGAILSGALFGNNLAPISDTTIVSAATQNTDIPGVVRSRFKYAIAAAIPATLLFVIFGGGDPLGSNQALIELKETVEPTGLIFLIPFAIVLIVAFKGHHIITSLTWGIVSSIALILIMGIPFEKVIYVNINNSEIGGALIDGLAGYFSLAILVLLILSGSYILEAAGLMTSLKNIFMRVIKDVIKRAELSIFGMTAFFGSVITLDTAAEITVSSFVREIGEEYNIHAYRRANLLDAVVCSVGVLIPWGGSILLAVTTVNAVSQQYAFIPAISPTQMVPFIFHGWLLLIVMLVAVLSGWGLRLTGKDGKPEKMKKTA